MILQANLLTKEVNTLKETKQSIANSLNTALSFFGSFFGAASHLWVTCTLYGTVNSQIEEDPVLGNTLKQVSTMALTMVLVLSQET